MKVKCIDAVSWRGRACDLVLGQVYQVRNVTHTYYYLDGFPNGWHKNRFVEVTEGYMCGGCGGIEDDGVCLHCQQEKEARVVSPVKDLSHWKAWQHNVDGECPCGIAKAQCSYHG
jgi:hypothetical protein